MKPVRLLGITFVLLLVAAGIHQLYYGFVLSNYSSYTLSNVFFATGVIVFFPTFALRINSGNLFLGFRYSVMQIFNPGKAKEYESFKDYYDSKAITKHDGKFLNEILVVSIIFVAVSLAIALS
jgi:TM2 domain-containing membrane protein YozV